MCMLQSKVVLTASKVFPVQLQMSENITLCNKVKKQKVEKSFQNTQK